MNLLLELSQRIDGHYGPQLAGPVETRLDALIARFFNGVTLEARIAAPNAYVFTWTWGEALLRIDTAPLHHDLATFPNHLHDAQGRLHHDPLTRCGATPWDNLAAVVEALIADPLLETHFCGATP